jgi:hypothetical protein
MGLSRKPHAQFPHVAAARTIVTSASVQQTRPNIVVLMTSRIATETICRQEINPRGPR